MILARFLAVSDDLVKYGDSQMNFDSELGGFPLLPTRTGWHGRDYPVLLA